MLSNKLFSAANSAAAGERLARFFRMLCVAFDALVTGSRIIPMGDNGRLLRELGERSGRLSANAR
jgi:hypothetical protein